MSAARVLRSVGARAALRLGIVVTLGLAGCERTAAPPGPVHATASRRADGLALRDWTAEPSVVDSERNAACPRLLSSAPNVTEICCGLGLGGRLVGRTRYCTYPPAIEAVPSIGALNDLNVEVLLELKPELILVSGTSRAITDRIARLGLRFESVPDWSLGDLFTGIARIGELTGRSETAARLCAGIRADLDAVAARYAGRPTYRVLLVTDPLSDPPTQPFAAGPGSFYDDLLRRAGHTNAAQAAARPFAPLALEFILSADPEVIIELAPDDDSRPGGDAEARRVWAKLGPLKAVAAGRVRVLAGRRYTILGPRIAQTFDALCRAIVGEQP